MVVAAAVSGGGKGAPRQEKSGRRKKAPRRQEYLDEKLRFGPARLPQKNRQADHLVHHALEVFRREPQKFHLGGAGVEPELSRLPGGVDDLARRVSASLAHPRLPPRPRIPVGRRHRRIVEIVFGEAPERLEKKNDPDIVPVRRRARRQRRHLVKPVIVPAVGEDDKEAAELESRFFSGDGTGNLFRGRGAAIPPPTQAQAGFGLGELRFCGGPDTVVQQITDFYEATGIGALDIAFGGAGITLEEGEKSMRLFATEVLPRIRHLGVNASVQPETAAAVGA